jgi:hypothetical protein
MLVEQPAGRDVLDGEEVQPQPPVPADPDAAGAQRDAKLRVAHLRVAAQRLLPRRGNLVAGAQRDGRVHGAMARAGVKLGGPGYARGAQRDGVGRVAAVPEELRLAAPGQRLVVGADQHDLGAEQHHLPLLGVQVAGQFEGYGAVAGHDGVVAGRGNLEPLPLLAEQQEERAHSGEERAHRR